MRHYLTDVALKQGTQVQKLNLGRGVQDLHLSRHEEAKPLSGISSPVFGRLYKRACQEAGGHASDELGAKRLNLDPRV